MTNEKKRVEENDIISRKIEDIYHAVTEGAKRGAFTRIERCLFWALLLISGLCVLLAIVQKLGSAAAWLRLAVSISMIISYILLIAFVISLLARERRSAFALDFFRNALRKALSRTLDVLRLIEVIEGFELKHIESFTEQLRHQCEAQRKRFVFIAGPLEKVGFLPGMLSLVVACVSTSEVVYIAAMALAAILLAMSLLGLKMHAEMIELDSFYIALQRLIAEKKAADKKE